MRLFPLLLLCLSACVSFVKNQPRQAWFDQAREPADVAVAVERAFERRVLWTTKSVEGQRVGYTLRTPVTCTFTVDFTALGVTVSTAGPTPKDDGERIDARCEEEAQALSRTIQSEVTRPERVARKQEKQRRARELEEAKALAWAEQQRQQQAWAAQQQQAQQQAWEEQQRAEAERQRQAAIVGAVMAHVPPPQPASPPPARAAPAPAPAPPPRTVQRSESSSTTTTWRSTNAAPPPAEPQVTLQPNTCCRPGGRAYLCPNSAAWAGVCNADGERSGDLARLCPNDPRHNRFCPR
ncbi:MAG: hypothetical protein ACOZQL_02985 [Myxococcota bacterium]